MRMHPYPLVVAIMLALAACRPGAAEWTESEAPKRLRLDDATAQVDLRFAPGSARLAPADAERLRLLAASGKLVPSDRVRVAAGGYRDLADARFAAISAELVRYGIVAEPMVLPAVPVNHAILESGRYLVTMPACPNWSKDPGPDYTNSFPSNYGCANAVNLGQSVATPADLVSGRPVGQAAGQPAATAVQRYLTDRVRPPLSSTSGAGAAGGGGAGGGGAGGGSSDTTGGSQQ